MSTPRHDYDRIPYLIAYQNDSGVRDVYGGVAELVVLESHLLQPRDNPSGTVLVFMHPIGGGAYLPMINALARAGHHVIYCNSRFRGTDTSLLMEKVVQDLGECIKDARDRLGYSTVVLAGWSGGGSLSVFYQQQAQHPTVTAAPSGDGPDLTKLDLIPADGLMLLAALLILGAVALGLWPATALIALLPAPWGWQAWRCARAHADDIPALLPAMRLNVLLNLSVPALLAIGLALVRWG